MHTERFSHTPCERLSVANYILSLCMRDRASILAAAESSFRARLTIMRVTTNTWDGGMIKKNPPMAHLVWQPGTPQKPGIHSYPGNLVLSLPFFLPSFSKLSFWQMNEKKKRENESKRTRGKSQLTFGETGHKITSWVISACAQDTGWNFSFRWRIDFCFL